MNFRQSMTIAVSPQYMQQLAARASAGLASAQYEMWGRLAARCRMFDPEMAIATSWLKKAAVQNYTPALVSLGHKYYDGMTTGVTLNKTLAFECINKAVNQGSMDATAMLGYMHMCGCGAPKDVEAGLRYLNMAIDSGNDSGAYLMGRCYFGAIGMPCDAGMAVHWWEVAARRGSVEAMGMLWLYYTHGSQPNAEKEITGTHSRHARATPVRSYTTRHANSRRGVLRVPRSRIYSARLAGLRP